MRLAIALLLLAACNHCKRCPDRCEYVKVHHDGYMYFQILYSSPTQFIMIPTEVPAHDDVEGRCRP